MFIHLDCERRGEEVVDWGVFSNRCGRRRRGGGGGLWGRSLGVTTEVAGLGSPFM